MRVAKLVVLGLLFVTPAIAQAQQIFGSYTCAQPVPCTDASPPGAPEKYVTAGNECMRTGLGYNSSTGFFDTIGLNSNSCLTYVPGTFPKGVGAQLTPVCCVIKADQNTCVFHCDLVENP